MSEDASFSFASVVRGYHIYKDIWEAPIGETLPCKCERSNRHDPFAVSITNHDAAIVGHVPRRISPACSMFLRRSGTIKSRIIGARQYSGDLAQGGLEIPCVYEFTGTCDNIHKLKTILALDLTVQTTAKKRKGQEKNLEVITVVGDDEQDSNELHQQGKRRRVNNAHIWVKISTLVLSQKDHDILSGGMRLNDQHMNAGQVLLKSQFPSLQGLGSTLSPPTIGSWVENYIQVMVITGLLQALLDVVQTRSMFTIRCIVVLIMVPNELFRKHLDPLSSQSVCLQFKDKLVAWIVGCSQLLSSQAWLMEKNCPPANLSSTTYDHISLTA